MEFEDFNEDYDMESEMLLEQQQMMEESEMYEENDSEPTVSGPPGPIADADVLLTKSSKISRAVIAPSTETYKQK